MAHENKVLRSIEAPGGAQCVDLFVRQDGSFGFACFRRDAEDGHGWFPTGNFGTLFFTSEADALADALRRIPWLKDLI